MECPLDLFADHSSAKTIRANQLRLWFAAMAYVLACALRRIALRRGRLRHDPPQASAVHSARGFHEIEIV